MSQKIQCGNLQNFLCKFVIFFLTLGLKILRLLRQKVVFWSICHERLILTPVKIINYLFSMNNCFVKASKSFVNSHTELLRLFLSQMSLFWCCWQENLLIDVKPWKNVDSFETIVFLLLGGMSEEIAVWNLKKKKTRSNIIFLSCQMRVWCRQCFMI